MLRWADTSDLPPPVTGSCKCYGLYETYPCAPDANIRVFDFKQKFASQDSSPCKLFCLLCLTCNAAASAVDLWQLPDDWQFTPTSVSALLDFAAAAAAAAAAAVC